MVQAYYGAQYYWQLQAIGRTKEVVINYVVVALKITDVHAHEHLGPVLAVYAPGPGLDFKVYRVVVIMRHGEQGFNGEGVQLFF